MGVVVDDFTEADVPQGDSIFRSAFGKFLQIEPNALWGDSDPFRTRWRASNTKVLAARQDRVLVGSNVLTRWGSLGWFGPLTIEPDLWDQGIGKALMVETERVFDGWGVSHRGLFTFAHSPKHLGLYERFGYWPGRLTPVFARSVTPSDKPPAMAGGVILASATDERSRADVVRQTRELCGRLLEGLDLSMEIESILRQNLGDVLFVTNDGRLDGFAVCHIGAGTESRSGQTYVKFGAINPGPDRKRRVRNLIHGVESLAVLRNAPTVEMGCNAAHRTTSGILQSLGYRPDWVGVSMMSNNDTAYHLDKFDVLDDLR